MNKLQIGDYVKITGKSKEKFPFEAENLMVSCLEPLIITSDESWFANIDAKDLVVCGKVDFDTIKNSFADLIKKNINLVLWKEQLKDKITTKKKNLEKTYNTLKLIDDRMKVSNQLAIITEVEKLINHKYVDKT